MIIRRLTDSVVFVGTDDSHGVDELFEEERACVRDSVAKRQMEFATGRWCLRKAIGLLGRPEFPILKGSGREPVIPDGIAGSISHTRSFCCALAGTGIRGAGVDVEFIDPEIPPDVWGLVYGEEERDKLAKLRELDFLKASFLVYSAKECIFKCLYPAVKRYFGFEAASAEIVPAEQVVRIRLNENLSPGFGRGMVFNVSYGFMPEHILTTVLI